ncbi:MAG: hypothetical protein ACJ76Y_17890 [Thermoanaerobaculia bacterium]
MPQPDGGLEPSPGRRPRSTAPYVQGLAAKWIAASYTDRWKGSEPMKVQTKVKAGGIAVTGAD